MTLRYLLKKATEYWNPIISVDRASNTAVLRDNYLLTNRVARKLRSQGLEVVIE